jgi:hypothetical protein
LFSPQMAQRVRCIEKSANYSPISAFRKCDPIHSALKFCYVSSVRTTLGSITS